MALAAATVVEVRSTGAATNGGGYVTGASGTDYSQQDAPQYALTNGTTDGSAVILTVSAAADMIGNIAYIAGGTGSIVAAWYQITAASPGVSITVDRVTGLSAGTGATINVGGSLSTIALGLALLTVGGMTMYVKATATYSIATGLSTPAGITAATQIINIIGYTTTRGDNGRTTIAASAAITMYTESRGSFRLVNFVLDGATGTGTTGASLTGVSTYLVNCIVKNFSGTGVALTTNNGGIIQSEVTGCASGIVSNQSSGLIKNNYVHANTAIGISVVNVSAYIIGNIIASNAGATNDGLIISAAYSANRCSVIGNVFYANGRDGVRTTGTYSIGEFSNNIFMNNVGIGLNTSALNPVRTDPMIHHNAFIGNGTARSGNNAGTGDVTLTADPFTSAATGDFSLNTTTGGGAALRGAGYPGLFVNGPTGYLDIGAVQHQDPATPASTGGTKGLSFSGGLTSGGVTAT